MTDRVPSDREPPEFRRLHGGRHGLSPDLVAYNQRERLLGAVAAAVADHGYSRTTIAQITDAASVSRRTFYENFSSKEECFVAAYDALDAHLDSLMDEAAKGQDTWPDEVAATFAAMVRFLASRPDLSRLYLLEGVAVGEAMLTRRVERPERFMALLAPGRELDSLNHEPAEGLEEALIGGVLTLLWRRVIAGEAEQLDRFVPAVVEFVLSPYLGLDEARRVAERHT